MRFFWILKAKKLKQFFILFIAFIFTLGIVYTEKENISVFSNDDGPRAIYSVETNKKQIALTFDVSWGEERPGPIIDILEQQGLQQKVTFFLSSPWSQDHPEIVQRLVEGGFEIGSHGHKHANYSKMTEEEIKNQILKADSILNQLTNQKPNLIRTPNGDFDNRVLKIIDQLDYTLILWDTDSKDWENPGVNEIVNNVMERVHPGDIILMHASDTCQQTHEALPTIIKRLRAEGYEFVTVSQLISSTEIKTKEVD